MHRLLRLLPLAALSFCSLFATVTEKDRAVFKETLDGIYGRMHATQLDNGMRVIVVPQKNTNQVALSLTYNVGKAHENQNEVGMAHLVEHMIFKGTPTMPEGQLWRIAQHLGIDLKKGKINATTGLDRTNYYFVTDAANWKTMANVMGDCAQNMDWDSSVLDSELKAVFQEIKLRKHDRMGDLHHIFGCWAPQNHPYAHSGIGQKEVLMKYSRQDVLRFYRKHYTPDRAVLMISGNVDPAEALAHVRDISFKGFAGSSRDKNNLIDPFFTNFSQTNRILYDMQDFTEHDFLWRGPRKHSVDAAALQYILHVLNRRLMHEWVDANGWCMSVAAGALSCHQDGVVYVDVRPKNEYADKPYGEMLYQVIAEIIKDGITDEEYAQVHRSQMRTLVDVAEYPEVLSATMTEDIILSRDPKSWHQYKQCINNVTQEQIKQVAYEYLRPFLCHTMTCLPLPKEEHERWNALQLKTDQHEKELLEARQREIVPSSAKHYDASPLPKRQSLAYRDAPEPSETFTLSNGMTVHYVHNTLSPTITAMLTLADSEEIGLSWASNKKAFARQAWCELVAHGTASLSKKDIDDRVAQRGAGLLMRPNMMIATMFKQDADEILGMLSQVLKTPSLPHDILQRLQDEFVEKKEHDKTNWRAQAAQRIQDTIKKAYPWSFTQEEQIANVRAITDDDIRSYHQVMTDPKRVVCTISGDITSADARALLEKNFGFLDGKGSAYAVPEVPVLPTQKYDEHVPVAIDDVVLSGVRPTVVRDHRDGTILMLVNRLVDKRVFNIRERTGLFYTGSGIYQCGSKRLVGEIGVCLLTQPPRLAALREEVDSLFADLAQNGITQADLDQLKGEWLHSDSDYTETNASIAGHLSGCVRADQHWQHQKEVRAVVEKLTLDEVNATLARYYDQSGWSFFVVGRR